MYESCDPTHNDAFGLICSWNFCPQFINIGEVRYCYSISNEGPPAMWTSHKKFIRDDFHVFFSQMEVTWTHLEILLWSAQGSTYFPFIIYKQLLVMLMEITGVCIWRRILIYSVQITSESKLGLWTWTCRAEQQYISINVPCIPCSKGKRRLGSEREQGSGFQSYF